MPTLLSKQRQLLVKVVNYIITALMFKTLKYKLTEIGHLDPIPLFHVSALANQGLWCHMDSASWWQEAKQDKDYLGDSKRMQCFFREGCRRSSLYLQIPYNALCTQLHSFPLSASKGGKNPPSFINCQGSCLRELEKGKWAIAFAYPICQEQDLEQTTTTKPPAKHQFLQFTQH